MSTYAPGVVVRNEVYRICICAKINIKVNGAAKIGNPIILQILLREYGNAKAELGRSPMNEFMVC